MGLFEDYIDYLNKYQKIYGPKTIVLYQNGSFFESYGVDNSTEKIGLVREISEMLNVQLTRRNKMIVENDRKNFLLAGFPLNQLDRYIALLTEEYGYVVIVVEQTTPPPNPKRDVTNIVSPSTNIKYISQPNSNYLASIYIENDGIKKNVHLLTIGLSAIDVSTGYNIVYETHNQLDDYNKAFDDTYRFIQSIQPREVLINTLNWNMNQDEISLHFDIGHCLLHYKKNDLPKDYYKISYQNEFISKIFTHTGMLTPIEYINLEKYPTAIISYISLLNFCYQQKESIIRQITCPVLWNNSKHLVLDNNCINQLNLISQDNSKISSLVSLLDQSSTPMGKRLLKEKLLLPITDQSELNDRYDLVDFFRQPTKLISEQQFKHLDGHKQYYVFQLFESHLKHIGDIERLHRKICLGMLQPTEFNQLDTSYQEINNIVKILINLTQNTHIIKLLLPNDLQNHLQSYIDFYQKILNLNETTKYNINNVTGSFFNRGNYSEIDILQDHISEYEHFFEQLCSYMSQIIVMNCSKPVVTYEDSADIGYHLETTTNRFKTFDNKCSSPFTIKTDTTQYIIDPKSFDVINNRAGKTCKIISDQITNISKSLKSAREQLLKKVVDIYTQFLSTIYDKFNQIMSELVIFISHFDMYKSYAKTSLMYNYCRPQFHCQPQLTYLNITQLRHPIIERIQENCQYVPQDIIFDEQQRGILLFGVNSSGKSSLMKAIGISVIMAQSGMFVPAQKFVYNPYQCILTRIIGNDNLFKGMSSFAVEMSELRGILKRANQHSLVLGDEICHGTETISAVSIVASSIITLNNLNTHFLFATHLHQLSQIPQITDLSTVKMFHLKVKFDENSGQLIYDRHLDVGPGQPIYGLEVAKAMDLDPNVIMLANQIRQQLMDTSYPLSTKKSKYNKEVYLGKCGIPDCPNKAEVTHHIHFQSNANDMGFIDNIQKNHKSNLLPLCRKCHDMLHDQTIGHYRYIVHGYIMTSNGPVLDYEKILNSTPIIPKTKIESETKIEPETKIEMKPKIEQKPVKKIILKMKVKFQEMKN